MAHAFNPSIQETEAGGSPWVQDQPGLQRVSGQPGLLHRETISKNKQTNKQTRISNNPKFYFISLVCFTSLRNKPCIFLK